MALPSRRISLECPVVDTGALAERVADLRVQHGRDISSVTPSSLHMTMFHVGKTDEVYAAVTQARTDYAHRPLDPDRFVGALRGWLRLHRTLIRHDHRVEIDAFSTLGDGPGLSLVARLSHLPVELRDVHAELVKSFARFLGKELNVPNGAALLRSSSVFGFSGKSWIPHITVGSASRSMTMRTETCAVTLGPMQIRNESSLSVVL